MKAILLFVSSVLLVGGLSKSLTRERFSLKLELENPTGKLDSVSHFRCTLTNLTDTAFLIFSGNFLDGRTGQVCYFRQEIIYKDGSRETSREFDGFRFMKDGSEVWMKRLDGRRSIIQGLPMFCDPRGYGAFPRDEEYIKKVKKFRIRLEKFHYENLGKLESVRGETLVSNWVEVDSEAVSAILRKERERWKR